MRWLFSLALFIASIAHADDGQYSALFNDMAAHGCKIIDASHSEFVEPVDDTKLTVWYRAEENAANTTVTDSSGNGNTGTSANNTSTMSTTGQVGLGFDFEGNTPANDAINVNSDTVLTGADSFCSWVNPSSAGENNDGRICDNGKVLWFINASASVQFTSDGAGTLAASANSALPINGSTKSFVCATRNASGTANIYVNAALSGTANQASGTPANGTSNLFVGNNSGNNREFDGIIDEFQHFSYELSAAEVAWLYARQSKGKRGAIEAGNKVAFLRSRFGAPEFYQLTAANRPLYGHTYASPTGLHGLMFNGSSTILSSSYTTASIFSASAKTLFVVLTVQSVADGDQIMGDASGGWRAYLRTAPNAIRFLNYDGSNDIVDSPTIVAARPVVASFAHDGSYLYARANGVEGSSIASGATAFTNGLLYLGNSTTPIDCNVYEIIGCPRFVPKVKRVQWEQALCAKWGADCS